MAGAPGMLGGVGGGGGAAAGNDPAGRAPPALQALQNAEQRVVEVVSAAARACEELASASGGVNAEAVLQQVRTFAQGVQEIQTTLRDEIRSLSEYRPYENSDYAAKKGAELSLQKLDLVMRHLNDAMRALEDYNNDDNSNAGNAGTGETT
eukprot:jgi/Chlat1/3396/Chrsp23S03743